MFRNAQLKGFRMDFSPGNTLNKNVKLLDCTLRDGGYYNSWRFDHSIVQQYIDAMAALQILYIELGFRFIEQDEYLGGCAYTTESFVNQYTIPENINVGVMINASDYSSESQLKGEELKRSFPVGAGASRVSFVRIAAHIDEISQSLSLSEWLAKRDFKVCVNIMQVSKLSLFELSKICEALDRDSVSVLYLADSLGNLDPNQMHRMVEIARSHFGGGIGVHAHDNKCNAVANSIAAIDGGAEFVDATITGMGRGAGNAATELLINGVYEGLPDECSALPLLRLIEEYFKPSKKQYGWGPNYFYYLAAMRSIHPTYVQEMLADARFSDEEICSVMDYLATKEESSSFDFQQLELGRMFYKNPLVGTWDPSIMFEKSDVLIIGPGPGANKHKEILELFIRKSQPKVIALNTVTPIHGEYIDARIACHPVRLLADSPSYKNYKQPLIAPVQMLPTEVVNALGAVDCLEFGICIASGKLEIHPFHVVLPRPLVLAYALGVVTAGGASRVFLAGFDGYNSEDPRQAESQGVFDSYCQSPSSIPIIAITPTNYNIVKRSVYAMV